MLKTSEIFKLVKFYMNTSHVSAIILAAGNGKRFGGKKQFIEFMGRPVWRWSYDTAANLIKDIVVVGINVKGGKSRQESVCIGLEKTKGKFVVIFDAARPLVTEKQVSQIIKTVEKYPSVSFGILPSDTIYENGEYKRSGLMALQVPQAFNRKMLLEAHRQTKIKDATDDTKIFLEVHGIKPKIIKGARNLHKLTVKEDLNILRML